MIVFIDGPLWQPAKELYDRIVNNKIISSNKDIVLFDDIEEADILSYFNAETKCIVRGSPLSLLLNYKDDGQEELHHDLLEIIQSKDYVHSFVIVNVPKMHDDKDRVYKYNMAISDNMMFLNDPLKRNQIQYQFNALDEKVFKPLFGEITHYLQINN